MLDIWPALPIVIVAENMTSKEDVANIIAALRQHNRVYKIYYRGGQSRDSLLKEFAVIDKPYPVLTSLHLYSDQRLNVPVLPNSFLSGSAPRLRSLTLDGILYPSVGKLLSSTTNLVQLSLRHIPHSRYIAPETIVPSLSTLSRLESLSLGLQHPQSRAHRTRQQTPPLTRAVFLNLTFLDLKGDVEYLEDMLSQIETPILDGCNLRFFNQLVFDTPSLGHFIRRTEIFTTIHRSRIEFLSRAVVVTLSGREEMANNDREALQLEISCEPLDWQLSAVAQILNSFLSSIPTLECLEIIVSPQLCGDEVEDIQWQEVLHLFTSVKDMTLAFEDSVRLVVPALQGLAGDRATEVLPPLQDLFIGTYSRLPSGPVMKAIGEFITTRRVHGHPLTVHYWDAMSGKYVQ